MYFGCLCNCDLSNEWLLLNTIVFPVLIFISLFNRFLRVSDTCKTNDLQCLEHTQDLATFLICLKGAGPSLSQPSIWQKKCLKHISFLSTSLWRAGINRSSASVCVVCCCKASDLHEVWSMLYRTVSTARSWSSCASNKYTHAHRTCIQQCSTSS